MRNKESIVAGKCVVWGAQRKEKSVGRLRSLRFKKKKRPLT